MPTLILGPLLRYVGETAATVWVETDVACEVTVTAGDGTRGDTPRAAVRTFHVQGHHYGLVVLDGLASGGTYPYQIGRAHV